MTKATGTFARKSFTESSNSFAVRSFAGSSNAFARKNFSDSTNAFVAKSFTTGGLFSRKRLVACQNAWSGDNISGDYFANFNDFEGDYFGRGTFGGIRHFGK